MSLTFVPMIAGPPQLGALETDWVPGLNDMEVAIAELQTKAQEFGKETFNNPIEGEADMGWLQAWNKYVEDLHTLKDAVYFNRWQKRADIMAMRQRFNDLVAWWHRIPGAVPTTKTPTFEPDRVSPPSTSIDKTVKWAAIGLVAIAAISALAQISPAIKGLLPKGGVSR